MLQRLSQAHRWRTASTALESSRLRKLWLLTAISGVLSSRAQLTVARMSSKGPIEKSDAKYNILAFGDSLTEGFYDSGFRFHPYSIKLNELLASSGYSAKVFERGNSGERVVGGMDRRLPALLQHFERNGIKLSWVLILGGINDLGYGADPDAVHAGLLSLYAACQQHGARVLAMTCLQTGGSLGDVHDDRTKLNELIRGTPAAHDYVEVLDLDPLLPFPRSRADTQTAALWDDYLHLTPAGYDTVGQIVYDRLRSKLEK